MVTSTDPLLDSDEENPDEHVRLDYSERSFRLDQWFFIELPVPGRRLEVINRLRGRPPTPVDHQAITTEVTSRTPIRA